MVSYKIYSGKEVISLIPIIAQMRIDEFKNYPYLYHGNLEYEKEYLRGFTLNAHSCLIVACEANKIIGLVTALPLKSGAAIVKDTEELFTRAGLNSETFFYLGEFIIDKNFRGRGIASQLEKQIITTAKKWQFSNVCLATVERRENDPRKPKNYISTDFIWTKLGYTQTNLATQYHWPMITDENEIQEQNNTLIFWTKVLA